MSGALTERDFVEKLKKTGFDDVEIVNRRAWGIDDCELYPLFTPDLIDLMRKLIPDRHHDRVATSIVIKARLPSIA